MKKLTAIFILLSLVFGVAITSCKSGKSSVDKRIHKKRKKKGSLDCPMKDC